MILVLLIVIGVALRLTTQAQREQLLRAVPEVARHLKDVAVRRGRKSEPFRVALRARTRWVLVTPALIALNATVFVFMLSRGHALSDPDTLVAWGGNFGPRTTNGEWWRLAASMFVHTGIVQLLVSVIGFVQIGLMLERLLGRLAFAAAYLLSGVFAALINVWSSPVAVGVSASGAIFGLYGVLLVVTIWGVVRRSAVSIPLDALKRLGLPAALFISYNMAGGGLGGVAQLAGFVSGMLCGGIFVKGVSERTPAPRRVATAMALAAVIAVVSAVPLRGVADVRPEIARVVAVEGRTAGAYKVAADRLSAGRITAEAVALLIERTIMPELQAAQVRLNALDRVPNEHQPLIADAEEYLRLRYESWRLRAEGLHRTSTLPVRGTGGPERVSDESSRLRIEAQHRTNMIARGKAEGAERTSLQAFARIRPVPQQ
ncbi:MAG TPA: rhomboid family intramembrane serine protease [Vicinamibacterales bacterium]|nr:rhomboid family intramembrane serine protease [Vicinamibacterales bacterium]